MAPESTMTLLEKELRELREKYWEHQNRLSWYGILPPTWKLSVREIYVLRTHRDRHNHSYAWVFERGQCAARWRMLWTYLWLLWEVSARVSAAWESLARWQPGKRGGERESWNSRTLYGRVCLLYTVPGLLYPALAPSSHGFLEAPAWVGRRGALFLFLFLSSPYSAFISSLISHSFLCFPFSVVQPWIFN